MIFKLAPDASFASAKIICAFFDMDLKLMMKMMVEIKRVMNLKNSWISNIYIRIISKQQILERAGRMGTVLSKWETPNQKRKSWNI